MIRRTPVSTRTDTLCPYTTLCRSDAVVQIEIIGPPAGADRGGALSEGVVLIGGQRDAVARDPGWASAGPVLQRSVADRPGQARWVADDGWPGGLSVCAPLGQGAVPTPGIPDRFPRVRARHLVRADHSRSFVVIVCSGFFVVPSGGS